MKFSIKDFFSKCDKIRRKMQIWSHLLKKSLMENFIFVQCLLSVLKLRCERDSSLSFWCLVLTSFELQVCLSTYELSLSRLWKK